MIKIGSSIILYLHNMWVVLDIYFLIFVHATVCDSRSTHSFSVFIIVPQGSLEIFCNVKQFRLLLVFYICRSTTSVNYNAEFSLATILHE